MGVATRRLAPGRPGWEGHLGGQAATANGQRVMLLFEARMRRQGTQQGPSLETHTQQAPGRGVESGGLEPQQGEGGSKERSGMQGWMTGHHWSRMGERRNSSTPYFNNRSSSSAEGGLEEGQGERPVWPLVSAVQAR